MSTEQTAGEARTQLQDLRRQMLLRTNPEFDLEIEPEENEFQYANPVAIKNSLITIGNAHSTLADEKVKALAGKARAKKRRAALEGEQDDLETEMLRDYPLSPTEAKSNKTVLAAIARRLDTTGKADEYRARRKEIRTLGASIDAHEATIQMCDVWLETAERVSMNAATFLSNARKEWERSGRGAYGA